MSEEPDQEDAFDRPSKGERKRAALDAQKLGEQLIELKRFDLAALGLPDPLLEAILEARRLTSRHALVRQRQYVGKLMRGVALEPIRAALAARSEHAARESQQFKRVEQWRDRLIAEGAPALEELMAIREGIDRADWQRRIAAARTEHDRLGGRGGAESRELFRALRALLDRATIDPQ